jgi:hypothetical protein
MEMVLVLLSGQVAGFGLDSVLYVNGTIEFVGIFPKVDGLNKLPETP